MSKYKTAISDSGKIITFEKSALKEICEMLDVPYDPEIICFTREGAIKNLLDVLIPKEIKDG